MKKKRVLLWPMLFVGGCHATADRQAIYQLQAGDGYLSSNTIFGKGPVSSDYTRVYYKSGGDDDRDGTLIISGDYLELNSVKRSFDRQYVICIGSGTPDRFKNLVERQSKTGIIIIKFQWTKECH